MTFTPLRLGVGLDRRAGAGVEVDEQQDLGAVGDRLLGLLLLGGLVALGVLDRHRDARGVERRLEQRPVGGLPANRRLRVRQQDGDLVGLVAAAASRRRLLRRRRRRRRPRRTRVRTARRRSPACGATWLTCITCSSSCDGTWGVRARGVGSSASWPARARAPSTSARSPRIPAVMRTFSAAAGIGEAADGVAHRVEQQVAGRGEVAADDHEVGVDEVAQVGHARGRRPGPRRG